MGRVLAHSAEYHRDRSAGNAGVVRAVESDLGERYFYCEGEASLLFTENETNTKRLVGVQNRTPYVKDGINDYTFIPARLVQNGFKLTLLKEEEVNLETAFMRLTKGMVQ